METGDLHYPGKKRITVHLIDGTDRTMVITQVKIDGPIVRFGRDDGSGWREFLSAPLTSIISWDHA